MNHCPKPPPVESESCGAVDEEIVRDAIRLPVVVPIARFDEVAAYPILVYVNG